MNEMTATNRPEDQGMSAAEALATIADHLDKDTHGFVLGPDEYVAEVLRADDPEEPDSEVDYITLAARVWDRHEHDWQDTGLQDIPEAGRPGAPLVRRLTRTCQTCGELQYRA